MAFKKGALTRQEKGIILAKIGKSTITELSAELNRAEAVITKFLEGQTGTKADKITSQTISVQIDFQESAEWAEMQKQFSKDELQYFTSRYSDLMSQFKEDILPSEKNQLTMALKIEILMNRDLEKIKRMEDTIAQFSKEINVLTTVYGSVSNMDDENKRLWRELTDKVINLQDMASSANTNVLKYRKEISDLFTKLRGTREQRTVKDEYIKQRLSDVVKELLNEAKRKIEGEHSEIMKLASEQEYARLAQLHSFADGEVDRPILNADTVDLGSE